MEVKKLEMNLDNNLDLARLILENNQKVLSKAFFSGGEQNPFPIDFGSMIPLTFFNNLIIYFCIIRKAIRTLWAMGMCLICAEYY